MEKRGNCFGLIKRKCDDIFLCIVKGILKPHKMID